MVLIAVLGMHRSGTSAITRGLTVLGVRLGAKLMPPAVNNGKSPGSIKWRLSATARSPG
jgi:hypothetical protein